MFSKELENLIQATLEDGVLEDYEKAALVKRAQAEGVDLTELEIYINSILQKRKRELENKKQAQRAETEQKKREAFGEKCPNCGQQRRSMALKCECGYEFTSTMHQSSVQKLNDNIQKIISNNSNNNVDNKGNNPLHINNLINNRKQKNTENNQICNQIKMFPVPNTKEDIIEFLSLSLSNSKRKGGMWGSVIGRIIILSVISVVVFIICALFGGKEGMMVGGTVVFCILFYGGMAIFSIDQDVIRYNKRADAWREKFEQVLMKGRSLHGDMEFKQQLDYFESMSKSTFK